MEKKQVQRWKPIWDKYKFVVLVAAAGIALLLWPSSAEKTDQTSGTAAAAETDETSLQDTEKRMEAILSHIHGVGQLELMLTLDKSAASQYVQDTELTYSGQTQAPDEYQRSSETVVLSGDGGSVVNSRVPSSMTSPPEAMELVARVAISGGSFR